MRDLTVSINQKEAGNSVSSFFIKKYTGGNKMYTLEEQNFIDNRLSNQGKNGLIAWLLWFFVGGVGAHRFYLGRSGSGIVMALVSLFISPFLFFLPTFIWIILDALMMNTMVKEENMKVQKEAEHEVLAMRKR